jgi:CRP/FNR family transcriptional regulator, cyclic AMP receptor protein
VQHDTLASLKNIPYFAEIRDEVLEKLAACAVKRIFPKNSVIINEGDEAGPLFIILSGKVRVYLSNEDGKLVTLSVQREGSYFGELSLIDDEPRSASVMTLEQTVCGLIPKQLFNQWLREHPDDAALGVMRGLTRRLRVVTETVRGLALSDVYGRLAKTLRDLAEEDEEGLVIREKISHQDLANMVGSSREMISKIMKDLNVGGYLSSESKQIRIHRKLPPSW